VSVRISSDNRGLIDATMKPCNNNQNVDKNDAVLNLMVTWSCAVSTMAVRSWNVNSHLIMLQESLADAIMEYRCM